MKTQRRFFNIPDQTHSPMPKPTQEAAPSAAPVKTLGILKPEGISRYIGNKIEPTMHQHFTTHWEGKKEVKVYPLVKAFTLTLYADIKKSKGSNAALDWDSRQKLKYTWVVAQETMRLYPTAPGALREAITDITYEGFTIPKGWENPKYFDEPESFDPSRFEGNVPVPYTWIPFGAGPRTWPGKDYARLVVLNFIHILITKFHLGNYTFSQ
ncbi:hypothetical protein JHK85_021671 [Glycine max]|nr:hypothetical protein JHK85_021671 [Glycine max]